MARIADELTFSLERVLQPLQKVVKCCSKIPDFVSSQWQWQTGMWVGGADARGADAHAFHGSKSRGGQQIRAQGVDEDVWTSGRARIGAIELHRGFIITR